MTPGNRDPNAARASRTVGHDSSTVTTALDSAYGASTRGSSIVITQLCALALIVAAFTHTTGGRPSATSRQVEPSSLEPNTFPLRVPK